jgi:hypothetical protein
MSFAVSGHMPLFLAAPWPTCTATAIRMRGLHFPHNTLRFFAAAGRLDCVFIYEPVFLSVVWCSWDGQTFCMQKLFCFNRLRA